MSTSSAVELATGTGALVFYVSVFIFALYSLILAYHWLRYGSNSPVTIPALALYGIGAALFIAFGASGLL